MTQHGASATTGALVNFRKYYNYLIIIFTCYASSQHQGRERDNGKIETASTALPKQWSLIGGKSLNF